MKTCLWMLMVSMAMFAIIPAEVARVDAGTINALKSVRRAPSYSERALLASLVRRLESEMAGERSVYDYNWIKATVTTSTKAPTPLETQPSTTTTTTTTTTPATTTAPLVDPFGGNNPWDNWNWDWLHIPLDWWRRQIAGDKRRQLVSKIREQLLIEKLRKLAD